MTFSQRFAANGTPLILRIVLGVIFIWAGSAKLFFRASYVGEDAAILGNMGVLKPAAPGGLSPTEPGTSVPLTRPGVGEPPAQEKQKASPPAEEPPIDQPIVKPQPPATDPVPAEADPVPVREDEEEPGEPVPPPDDESPTDDEPEPEARGGGGFRMILAQNTSATTAGGAYTAADFGLPVEASRVHTLSVLLYKASHPTGNEPQLWPSAISGATAIKAAAWAAAITEFLAGVLILVGFLTRLWALGILTMMIVAAALTQVGPALASGTPFLGFLPQPKLSSPEWVSAWQTLLFQLIIAANALCLVFMGPGRISLDQWVFGLRRARHAQERNPPPVV